MSVLINASTSTGLVQSADTSGEIELQSNGTTALKVNTNEGIQILNCLGVGNATPSTSGAGITFPATQSASTDANTLDDYEEGTWTPTIQGDAGATGQAYTTQNGTYTKIGRQVTLMFTCQLSTKGTLSGTYVQVKGFPFVIAALPNLTGGSPIYFTNLSENWIYLSLQTEASGTAAYVWGQTAASASRTYIGFSGIGNTTQFNCCLTYFV